jgi:Retinal pigment epithelial membrane protein
VEAHVNQIIPDSLVKASGVELSSVPLAVRYGALPEGLAGHVFFVGPSASPDVAPSSDSARSSVSTHAAASAVGPVGGAPLGAGPGMIYRIDFDGEARVSSKLARTPCAVADVGSQPGSRFEQYRFESHGYARLSMALGLRDQLSSALVTMTAPTAPPRLLVTYDAGRPYEVDPRSLDFITPVGRSSEWTPAVPVRHPFPIVLTAGHPAVDPRTGELFTVNYGRKLVSQWTSSGPLLQGLGRLPEPACNALAERLESSLHEPHARRLAAVLEAIRAHLPQAGEQALRRFVGFVEGSETFTHLLRWDGEGALERFTLMQPSGEPVRAEQSLHQVGLTRDHVVLAEAPLKLGVEGVLNDPVPQSPGLSRLLRALTARPEPTETALYLVSRSALVKDAGKVEARRATLPLSSAHIFVDHDDTGGVITVHAAHGPPVDAPDWIRAYDQTPAGEAIPQRLWGLPALGSIDASRLGRYRIDTASGSILDQSIFGDPHRVFAIGAGTLRDASAGLEPPDRLGSVYWQGLGLTPELATAFLDSIAAERPNRLVSLSELRGLRAEGGRAASLFRFDHQAMAIADAFTFAAGEHLGAIQFVPRAGSTGEETDGFVVAVIYGERGSELWVFDAAALAAGPRCKLGHDALAFGQTRHGAYLPALAPRAATYHVSTREDLEQDVAATMLPGVGRLFEVEVYPKFPG